MNDNVFRERLLLIDKTFDLAMALVKLGIPCWALVNVVQALAGQETVVNVAMQYFSKGGNLFPWAATGGTAAWAYGERKFRHKKVASMSKHIKDLEERIDPKRTSSGLTAEGKTPSNPKVIRGGRK